MTDWENTEHHRRQEISLTKETKNRGTGDFPWTKVAKLIESVRTSRLESFSSSAFRSPTSRASHSAKIGDETLFGLSRRCWNNRNNNARLESFSSSAVVVLGVVVTVVSMKPEAVDSNRRNQKHMLKNWPLVDPIPPKLNWIPRRCC